MRAPRHVWTFRLGLLSALAAFSLNCEEGEDCGCLDEPPSVPVDDDDDDTDDGAQVSPLPPELLEILSELPACEGGVVTAFAGEEIAPPDPGSEAYLPPSSDTLEAIAASIESVGEGRAQLAHALVAVVGYQLCRGTDVEEGVVLWRPLSQGTGRSLFAWRLHEPRPVQIGVPHPWQHPQTLGQARRAFTELRARTLVSAGAHRCSNSEASGCSGEDICGPAPTISDMAYSRDTVYQVAHEAFADAFEADLIVALEGRTEPGVSVSEGVLDDLQSGGAAIRVLDALVADGEEATACASGARAPSRPSDCGIDNVQGLYINGSAEACGPSSPEAVSGRFVHLAQSADVAGDAESVLEALDSVVGPRE